MTICQSASVSSIAGLWIPVTALLTRMSTRPNWPTISPTTRPTSGRCVTSALNAAHLMPSRSNCWIASCVFAASRARIATVAPACPRANAKARPRPRLPPVTTATFPVSLNVSSTDISASLGNQRDLDGLRALRDKVQALLEVGDRELVGADLVHRQPAGLDHPDRARPAVWAQVCATDIEFLVVTDDAPVDADVVLEHAVLDEGAELAEQVETLRNRGRMARPLEVHVGAVPVGEVLDVLDDVGPGDVQRDVGAALPGHLELGVRDVERDDVRGELRGEPGDHAETDRPRAGHDHDVLEVDVRPLDGMQRARQRLGEGRVRRWQILGDLVDESLRRIDHV